jgi:hypothetical protein
MGDKLNEIEVVALLGYVFRTRSVGPAQKTLNIEVVFDFPIGKDSLVFFNRNSRLTRTESRGILYRFAK